VYVAVTLWSCEVCGILPVTLTSSDEPPIRRTKAFAFVRNHIKLLLKQNKQVLVARVAAKDVAACQCTANCRCAASHGSDVSTSLHQATMDNSPVLVDILLIGGGHAHVYVLKMFGMQPMPGVRLTLITKHAMTPYSGMIPGHVAGHYTKKECHVDLVRLAKFAGARFILGEVTAIDRFAKTVSLKGPRPDISFDIATVDIGSTPQSLLEVSTLRRQREQERAAKYATKQSDKEDSDGFIVTKSVSGGGAKRAAGDETSGGGSPAGGSNATELPDVHSKAELQALSNVTPVKPIDGFSARWDAICEAVRTAPSGKQFRLVTVGGGAGGVELALSMSHRLREILKERGDESVSLHMTLLTRGAAILSSHNGKVQKCMMRILRERNVEVHLNSEAVGAMPYVGTPGDGPYPPVGLIECVDGSSYTFDDCVWCTQAKGAAWLADTGLDLDDMGFIKVTDTLESVNTPGIFACGDIACVVNQPRPKAGVYAVRQGKPLFDNLRRVASGLKPLPFKQQTSNLAILGCGGGYAVASKGSWLKLEGQWVWRLKDWIDRKWMTMYSDLPDIEEMMKDMALNSATQLRALGNLAASQGPDALEVLSHAAMRCGGLVYELLLHTCRVARLQLFVGLPPDVVQRWEPQSCRVSSAGSEKANF